ncbi:MAG: thiamine phosphate synthase [Methanomassiliicoccus sp.]|nr:thiamine phosphate synthase [Methanomassiliicoccus sp.]
MALELSLYVVTDRGLSLGRGHLEVARQAVAGGADVIQLRDKNLTSAELYHLAVQMGKEVQGAGRLFVINDRLDIALAAGADGVHLGQDDLPAIVARAIAPHLTIGVSVSSVDEAVKAERDGADYIAVSPLFETRSKGDAGPGHGLKVLRAIKEAAAIPVIGIGGIDRSNVTEVIESGADGVAVISAVVSQPDIEVAARELRSLVTDVKGRRVH